MTRPDLQPGYEGWQALDPTPQEKSEGGLGRSGPITEMKKQKLEGTHSPEGLPREGQRAGMLTRVWLTPKEL